jgi:transposase InsO family protein
MKHMHLSRLSYRLGYPKIIISDQGREFNNALLQDIVKILGTDHRNTSAYHPQCNGLTGG